MIPTPISVSTAASDPDPISDPGEALRVLLEGNARFVAGNPEHPNQDAGRRAALAPAQRPFAVLFGCSDSRLAAEIIFDQGLGDLFVVRTAGHVTGAEALGSIEYGVSVLGCALVVVLGHDSCGAVAAALDSLEQGRMPGGFVRDVVERVTPSVLSAKAAGIEDRDAIVDEHIRQTVDLLVERSQALAAKVAQGTVAVVGLSYRLRDGQARQVAARGPVG
ncbi:carbonic anhydrase [Streptomyces sp. 1331.2]|uniref:carbonic anhydrase n=1 Tax=Streptomyces sp. 1331.2 TaxID=1938835 RepID=UPI000BCC7508|nr:carbonic anhydrase [Streptomyces sp. 1331.2]SOB78807.1 carbonic anhydrase [Streptomyces sp. 1331.2]SOB86339.1 carbonic anhydrase [Streptomyces sp. 1331.2]